MTRVPAYRAVVDSIRAAGVRKVFCVPGESFVGVMDELWEDPEIALISGRHETGAALAAAAYARVARVPGVMFATRAVGATNMANAIYSAYEDGAPLVAVIGQVNTTTRNRPANQELDLSAAFTTMTKWTVEAPTAERIPEILTRAFGIAMSGRPGPVVVGLPADLLDSDIEFNSANGMAVASRPHPNPHEVARAVQLLRAAKRPLLLVGGGAEWAQAEADLVALAEACAMPVVTAFRRVAAFPNRHPQYIGCMGPGSTAALHKGFADVDLTVAIGLRLDEGSTSGFSLMDGRPVIHADVEPRLLSNSYPPTVSICADPAAFARALADAARDGAPLSPDEKNERLAWIRAWKSKADERPQTKAPPADGTVDPSSVVEAIQSVLPADFAMAGDTGNFFIWFIQQFRWPKQGSFYGPASSTMGYALPTAMGIKLARPDLPVVAITGDGGLMMTIGELETAVRYEIPVIALVWSNAQYGTIRGYQVRRYRRRYPGTKLTNPDFAKVAKLFGAHGETVTSDDQLPGALRRALDESAGGRPVVVDVRVDGGWIDPGLYD